MRGNVRIPLIIGAFIIAGITQGAASGGPIGTPLNVWVPKEKSFAVSVGRRVAVHLATPPGTALRWSLDTGYEPLLSVEKRPLFSGRSPNATEAVYIFRANRGGRTKLNFLLEDLRARKVVVQYLVPAVIVEERTKKFGLADNGKRVELLEGSEFRVVLPGGPNEWTLVDSSPNLLVRLPSVEGGYRFRVDSSKDSGVTLPLILRKGSKTWRVTYRVLRTN